MKKYLNYYSKEKKVSLNIFKNLPPFSTKQKISVGIFLFAIGFVIVKGQFVSGEISYTYRTIVDILNQSSNSPEAVAMYVEQNFFVQIIKNAIQSITNSQLASVNTVAGMDVSFTGIFSKIETGLTIFACIACFYKLVNHFFRTERHDNLTSIFGYFSYLGILLLFIFSSSIVNHIVSLNSAVNTTSVKNIGNTINQEIDKTVLEDYKKLEAFIKDKDDIYENLKWTDVGPMVSNRIEVLTKTISHNTGAFIKYIYFGIFGILLTCTLAIPSFIITFAVKILLSVMIAGAKIVFLLAFIPGFENAWKTYLLNLLNVVLWIPIFNVIITFIISMVSMLISSDMLNSGSIIWLSIVALVCASQSISLTTTCANSIISGASAGAVGAMNSLSAMNGAGMVAGAVATGSAVAGMAIRSRLKGKE